LQVLPTTGAATIVVTIVGIAMLVTRGQFIVSCHHQHDAITSHWASNSAKKSSIAMARQ